MALCALATDLPRYVEAEPRLRRARWLDPGEVRQGMRAEVVGDIPFTLPLIRRVIGPPSGIATLEQYAPPGRFTYRLETDRAIGRLEASFADTAAGCVVEARGWIVPRQRLARLVLAPLGPLLREMADQAVARGLRRAVAAAQR